MGSKRKPTYAELEADLIEIKKYLNGYKNALREKNAAYNHLLDDHQGTCGDLEALRKINSSELERAGAERKRTMPLEAQLEQKNRLIGALLLYVAGTLPPR